MQFFNKYCVFIVSAGRTGTKYFGTLLDRIVENSFSVHEPDIFSGFNKKLLSQIKTFGFYNMVLGRAARRTGIRNLSENYLAGKLTLQELKDRIVQHRARFFNNITQDMIIESYYGWYGCIPAIQEIFPNYKIIVITRDPRTWITSNMNWEKWYGKKDFVSKLKLERLNPHLINDIQYKHQWARFSRFEKLCWAYKTVYSTILENVASDPHARIFKFEDLFYGPQRYHNLNKLLNFLVDFRSRKFSYHIPQGILEEKVHRNISDSFPPYEHWDAEKNKEYWSLCEDIHFALGYD